MAQIHVLLPTDLPVTPVQASCDTYTLVDCCDRIFSGSRSFLGSTAQGRRDLLSGTPTQSQFTSPAGHYVVATMNKDSYCVGKPMPGRRGLQAMNSHQNRRQFLGTAAAMVAPTVIPARVLGRDGAVAPSEKITLGVIGIGPRCTYDLQAMLKLPTSNALPSQTFRPVDEMPANNWLISTTIRRTVLCMATFGNFWLDRTLMRS